MPYYITQDSADCPAWAVIKADGEVIGCHDTKQSAIDQAVAISIAEDEEFVGERSLRAEAGSLKEGDFVSWNSSGGRARGRIEYVMTEGTLGVPDSEFSINATPDDPAALIRIYRQGEDGWKETETLVGHKFSTLTKIEPLNERSEHREVNLTPPAYMRAAARQGLRYYEEGKGGDGLVDRTIREARAMANGSVTADKWVRLRAWISRHLSDLDAPDADPNSPDYPSAGVVAHLLWGSGPSKGAARRALAYADGVVTRLEAENKSRSVEGDAMAKFETRTIPAQFEIREDAEGMRFEGYAAIFDSPSEPLPFIERIARGAFRTSLRKSRNDIKLLWNHDAGAVLGSTRAKTLTLTEDERGLKVSAILPDTTWGRDARELLKRGDVDSMSFGFSVPSGGDTWNSEGTERILKSVRLHEVSIVAFPAYPATAGTTSVRGMDLAAQRANVDADELADAIVMMEAGGTLTTEAANILRRVIDALAKEEEMTDELDLQEDQIEAEAEQAVGEIIGVPSEPETNSGDISALELIKAKLWLLERK